MHSSSAPLFSQMQKAGSYDTVKIYVDQNMFVLLPGEDENNPTDIKSILQTAISQNVNLKS